jgi:hypothetical protein
VILPYGICQKKVCSLYIFKTRLEDLRNVDSTALSDSESLVASSKTPGSASRLTCVAISRVSKPTESTLEAVLKKRRVLGSVKPNELVEEENEPHLKRKI